MDLGEIVRRRRMRRRYEQRPVPAEVVDGLLDTARRAPSAGFSQGLDFLVLDEPRSIQLFWELTEDPRFPNDPAELAEGPTVLVVAFSDPTRYVARYSEPDKLAFGLDRAEAWPYHFWDLDTAMACMLLLMAAVDAGLGGWLFGPSAGEPALRAAFGVPRDRNLIAVVGLGYPLPEPKPVGSAYSRPRRPLAELVHRNGW